MLVGDRLDGASLINDEETTIQRTRAIGPMRARYSRTRANGPMLQSGVAWPHWAVRVELRIMRFVMVFRHTGQCAHDTVGHGPMGPCYKVV
jgi:hypothetical protein